MSKQSEYNEFDIFRVEVDLTPRTEEQHIWMLRKDHNYLLKIAVAEQTQAIADVAIELHPENYVFLRDDLKSPELTLLAIRASGGIIQVVPYDQITQALCKEAVQQRALNYQYLPKEFQTDEIKKQALQSNIAVIRHMPKVKAYWDERFDHPIYPILINNALKQYDKFYELTEKELAHIRLIHEAAIQNGLTRVDADSIRD